MVAIARVANCVGRLLFDTRFQKTLSASLRGSTKAAKALGNSRFTKFGKQVGDAFVAAEKRTAGNTFFKDMKNLLTTYPGDMKAAWKGAKGFKGKASALLQTTKARGPLLGAGLLLGFEVPNILRATFGDSVLSGAVEAGKATARLSGATLGACIGTALLPGIGSMIGGVAGWMLGDFVTAKIVGKSYTEKKLAEQQKLNEILSLNNQAQMYNNAQVMNDLLAQNMSGTNFGKLTLSQAQLMQLQNCLYGNKKLDLQM